MKRKNLEANQFQKEGSIKKLKKLYRYYLVCMKDGSISQADKDHQTNLIKCLLWRLGIHAKDLEQKDFGKKFIAGEYDEQLDLSILDDNRNKTHQEENLVFSNIQKSAASFVKEKENVSGFLVLPSFRPQDEQFEKFKIAYDMYCNGVLSKEEYLLAFQSYFDSSIDVYGLSILDTLAIAKKELSRDR